MSSATGTSRAPRAPRRCGYCRQVGHDRRRCDAYKRHMEEEERTSRLLGELSRAEAQLDRLRQEGARLTEMRAQEEEEVISKFDFEAIGEHVFINDEFPENLEGTYYTAGQVWLIHEAVNSANGVGSNLQALENVFSGRSPNVVERDHPTDQRYGNFRVFLIRDKKIHAIGSAPPAPTPQQQVFQQPPQETSGEDADTETVSDSDTEVEEIEDDTMSMMSEIPGPISPEDLTGAPVRFAGDFELLASQVSDGEINEEFRGMYLTAQDAWRVRNEYATMYSCDVEDTLTGMLDIGFPYPTEEEFAGLHGAGIPHTYGDVRCFLIRQDGNIETYNRPDFEPITPPSQPRPQAPVTPPIQPRPQVPPAAPQRPRASSQTVESAIRSIEAFMPDLLHEYRVHLTPAQQVMGLTSIIGEAIVRFAQTDSQGQRTLTMGTEVMDYIRLRMTEEYTAQMSPMERRAAQEPEPQAFVPDFDEYRACDLTETSCPICMEEFEENKNQMVLPCGHRFHTTCMLKCMITAESNSNSCPMCRTCFVQM